MVTHNLSTYQIRKMVYGGGKQLGCLLVNKMELGHFNGHNEIFIILDCNLRVQLLGSVLLLQYLDEVLQHISITQNFFFQLRLVHQTGYTYGLNMKFDMFYL